MIRGGLVAAFVMVAPLAMAQSSGDNFELRKHTIDSGGGQSNAGEFSLSGAIAQPDVTPQPGLGGPFRISGGFLSAAPPRAGGDSVFSDGFEEL